MNVYEKLQAARVDLQQRAIPKSGKNQHAGYTYHELADFLPHVNQILNDHKLCSVVSFTPELATLAIINAEKPDEMITFTSPMAEASLRGVQPIQNVGAVQTYQRRYLYMMALEIVEHDALDASAPNENRNGQAKATRRQTAKAEQAENESIRNGESAPAPPSSKSFTERLKAAVAASSQKEVAANAGVPMSSVAKAASGLDIPDDDRQKLDAFLSGGAPASSNGNAKASEADNGSLRRAYFAVATSALSVDSETAKAYAKWKAADWLGRDIESFNDIPGDTVSKIIDYIQGADPDKLTREVRTMRHDMGIPDDVPTGEENVEQPAFV